MIIPQAYFQKLKQCYDETHRIRHSASKAASLSDQLQKNFRNVPEVVRPRPRNDVPPSASSASSSSSSVAPQSSEEDMDGQGDRGRGGASVMQQQRNLNLALTAGNTANQGSFSGRAMDAPSVAGDNYTERPVSPADLREVGSITRGTLAGDYGHRLDAERPRQMFSTNKIGERASAYVTTDETRDWFYLEK